MLVQNAIANNKFSTHDDDLPRSVETLRNALNKVVSALLELLDIPDNGEQHNSLLPVKTCTELVSQINELSSAFSIAGCQGIEKLLVNLQIALKKIIIHNNEVSMSQRAAIIECCYILPRYFDFITEQQGIAEQPLLLAQSLHSLARSGLTPFVPENQLSDFEFHQQAIPSFSPVADSSTFRRLRQMYQIGLIGLLKNQDVSNQLSLLTHVTERILTLDNSGSSPLMWQLLSEYLSAIGDKSLSLTAQRSHFFSRFDRHLRSLEKQSSVNYDSAHDTEAFTELAFLLVLSGRSNWLTQQLSAHAEFKPLFYCDNDICTQREQMERGIDEAITAICTAVNSQLSEIKARLSVMSESCLCEENDQRYIINAMHEVIKVLHFCGFSLVSKPLQQALAKIDLWIEVFPDESELMEIANAILYIENAMLGFSTPGISDGSESLSVENVAEQSVFEHARQVLYTEMQSSIELSKRAIKSFSESNYERKHIANLCPCFATIEGGFHLSEENQAAELMQGCSDFVNWMFKSEFDIDKEKLPILADSLLATDYLLKELIAGRNIERSLMTLIEENTEALSAAIV